jgi:hypothetical protein
MGMATSPRNQSEMQILRDIIQAMRAMGLEPHRRNTGAVGGVKFNEKGDPDLDAIVPEGPHRGKTLSIEVKRPGKRPTDVQYKRMRRILQLGGLATWVTDVEDVLHVVPRVLRGWGLEITAQGEPWVYPPDRPATGNPFDQERAMPVIVGGNQR